MGDLLINTKTLSTQVFSSFRALSGAHSLYNSKTGCLRRLRPAGLRPHYQQRITRLCSKTISQSLMQISERLFCYPLKSIIQTSGMRTPQIQFAKSNYFPTRTN